MTIILPENPYEIIKNWLKDAEEAETSYPNAMQLATVGSDGMPSIRTMLLKSVEKDGLIFYTNEQSRKGGQMKENPKVAACLYWKPLKKQIHIEGTVKKIPEKETDAYFATRPRQSRIGAWASQQSRPVDKYETFMKEVKNFEEKFKESEEIPRPPYWHGFKISPVRIEFWMEGDFRLHERHVYTKSKTSNTGWDKQILYP